jgi:uncharacterized low-complexity protein
MNRKTKLALAVGSTLATSVALAPAQAASNPFALTALSSGYQLAQADAKQQDGKCGEAKCGANKAKETKEAACGANKAKEGSCGADPKMKEAACGGNKKLDAACGANKKS